MAMSLNYTNHLIDLPQVHTFVNAYAPSGTTIRAAIEKLTGKRASVLRAPPTRTSSAAGGIPACKGGLLCRN